MPKRGRPKVKKAEFKKPFPMRFSDMELRAFEKMAGDVPLREWMRRTLMASVPEGELPELDPQAKQAAQKVATGQATKKLIERLSDRKQGPQAP